MESAFAAALCHLLKISEFLSPKIFSLISSGNCTYYILSL